SKSRVSAWAAGFVLGNSTDTLALLKDLNAGISAIACYQAREDEGTQTPTRTLDVGRGSCRDFALLFVEAARSLGFGARLVSGYNFAPALLGQAGTTHAWAEVFLPVAVARDLSQAAPVSGSFVGGSDDLLRLTVAVNVNPN